MWRQEPVLKWPIVRKRLVHSLFRVRGAKQVDPRRSVRLQRGTMEKPLAEGERASDAGCGKEGEGARSSNFLKEKGGIYSASL